LTGVVIALSVFAVAVLVEALFAGYETGFVQCNAIRIRYLAEEEHLSRAARLLRYLNTPDRLLTTLLVGTNIGTVAATVAFTRQFGHLAALLVATPILVLFAEVLPKSMFRAHPNRLTLALLPVMRVFHVLLWPIAAPLTWLTVLAFRASGARDQHIRPLMSSLEDVRFLIDESADHGDLEREEQRMIHSVIDMQRTQAKEIMVPRIEIQALADTATRDELLSLFAETGRTRVPIYHESVDSIIGVVNAHDVLRDIEAGNGGIGRFVRDVMHVPDTMKVDALFEALKNAKQHMAIVMDEYGGTDGLITIEDILEEIFGEIQDEHDIEETRFRQVGPDAYVIDARLSLEEAAEVMNARLTDEDVETVGGWLMHLAGRIPLPGEVILVPGFRVTVLDGERNHIDKVRIEVLPEAKEQAHVEV
jgi:putative hemolysin